MKVLVFNLVFFILILLLSNYTCSIVYSQEDKTTFLDNPYGSGQTTTLRERNVNLQNEKKGKKSKKKNKEVDLELDKEEIEEEVAKEDSKPPMFPCEDECQIVDEELPNVFCRNKCGSGSKCQGRIDTRIWPYYFAVCVPI